MSVPKRHHYVPQSVLRRFTNFDGKLWVYNKKATEIGVCARSPKDVFFVNHLYSVINQEGSKDAALELAFSRLEGLIHPIFNRICDFAKIGQVPSLSYEERSLIDQYIYLQWKRTPDSLTASMSQSDFRDKILEGIEELEQEFRPITDAERQSILNDDAVKRLFHNVKANVIAQPGGMVLEAMERCGLAVGIIPDSKSLVIGSRPVVKITTPQEKEIGSMGVEVWLPVSSRIAIGHVVGPRERVVPIEDPQLIRLLNLSIARQSTSFAGRNKRLISSLARNKN